MGMSFVPAQAEAIHIVFSPAETTAKAGDMVTSKERITITPPYGVREYFYSYPFSRSEECRLVPR
jgi:hypothetical protein